MNESASAAFWAYSLQLYNRDEVARTCLYLQNSYDADVNLLLFCCWAGTRSATPLAQRELVSAVAAARIWQTEVVRPLRAIRRHLKSGADLPYAATMKETLLKTELEAERIEQCIITDATVPAAVASVEPEARATAITTNLERYLALLTESAAASDDVRCSISQLAQACDTSD